MWAESKPAFAQTSPPSPSTAQCSEGYYRTFAKKCADCRNEKSASSPAVIVLSILGALVAVAGLVGLFYHKKLGELYALHEKWLFVLMK